MKKITTCIIVTLTLFFICTAFLQDYDLSKSIVRGKEVYISNCLNCHLADGSATPDRYPPLIIIVLEGQTGEILVNGKKYNEEMLPQDYLSDAEIADVLNYVRNSWGNKMAAINPQQVKALRK